MRVNKSVNVGLWVLQGFLALFFVLGSGAPKLFIPIDQLPMPIPLSDLSVKLIGVCEILGGLGLILPGLLRIRPGLTVAAALGLALLTICATAAQLSAGQVGQAIFAAGMCLLVALVAYGRWQVAPLGVGAGYPDPGRDEGA